MIVSFANRKLERFWREGDVRGIKPELAPVLRAVLIVLDEAEQLSDLKGLRLHQWKKRPRRWPKHKPLPWSLDVNGPWRVTFQWEEGNAYNVDFCQPH
jgi:proteic killer suppression protein